MEQRMKEIIGLNFFGYPNFLENLELSGLGA